MVLRGRIKHLQAKGMYSIILEKDGIEVGRMMVKKELIDVCLLEYPQDIGVEFVGLNPKRGE